MLAHERIVAQEKPEQWMFFIHGFLGKGQNWRSFAQKFVSKKPKWGAVLVDLRLHGNSTNFKEPHTLKEAALDVLSLRSTFLEPVPAILGHSFGAKVALRAVDMAEEPFRIAWLIDFQPWAQNNIESASSTYKVLKILASIEHKIFKSREAFIVSLERAGLSRPTAQWLSMNGKSEQDNFRLNLNISGLKMLLDDYFKQDLMPVLEDVSKPTKINLVMGGRSLLLNENDRARIIKLAESFPSHLRAYLISDAGHDVHMDCPEALLELLTKD